MEQHFQRDEKMTRKRQSSLPIHKIEPSLLLHDSKGTLGISMGGKCTYKGSMPHVEVAKREKGIRAHT